MKFILLLTSLLLFTLAITQEEIKPYVKLVDGTIIYSNDIEVKNERIKVGPDKKFKRKELLSYVHLVASKKGNIQAYSQRLNVKLGESTKADGELSTYYIDYTKTNNDCFVIFADENSILVNMFVSSNPDLDGSTRGVYIYILLEDSIATKIDNYFSTDKQNLGYSFLKESFPEATDLHVFLDKLILRKRLDFKEYREQFERIEQLYFLKYYREL